MADDVGSWLGDIGKGLDAWGQQAGKDLDAFGQDAGKSLDGFGQEVGKNLDAFGQDAGKSLHAFGQDAGESLNGFGQEVGKHINGAPEWIAHMATEAGKKAEQAAKDAKAEMDKIDLTGANEWIHEAATDVANAIDTLDDDGKSSFEKWLKKASEVVGVQALLSDLQVVKLEDLPADTVQYVRDNPAQTTFLVVGTIALFAPGVIYGPMLKVLGFGAGGVAAGSAAAGVQSSIGGTVRAGSWFARLTSAGAGGYGTAALNGIARAGVMMAGAAGVTKKVTDRAHNQESHGNEESHGDEGSHGDGGRHGDGGSRRDEENHGDE